VFNKKIKKLISTSLRVGCIKERMKIKLTNNKHIKKIIYLLPFLLLYGCVTEKDYNEVLSENDELKKELIIQKRILSKLEKEYRVLESELEITKMLLEKCNDKIYGDAFVITRSGSSGYLRLEGMKRLLSICKIVVFDR